MASAPDRERRRVMFAMDFRDPATGLRIAEGIEVKAEGLGSPIRAPSGLFVWLDFDPPAPRPIKVTATSPRQRFAPFEEVIAVPAHLPGTPSSALAFPRTLTPTGLYKPPEGMTGAAGWLTEDGGDRSPVAGASVAIAFRHAGIQTFVSSYRATTDARGAFVALANDLGDIQPDPAPADVGGVLAWLVVQNGSQTQFSGFQPLRTGRVTRFDNPFPWATLNDDPP